MKSQVIRNVVITLCLLCTVLVGLNAQQCLSSCLVPDCSCPRITYPMPTRDIPQIVYFGFDDAVNVVMSSLYERIFTKRRKNPNGCRMKMSLYVSHQYTDYKKVKRFYDQGNEIGVHSVTHTAIDNDEILRREAKEQKENIMKAGIPEEDIVGWRSPFLKTAGKNQPQILKELGFEYDISLTYTRSDISSIKPWPFTMDHGWPYACGVEPCPVGAHVENFWAIPVNSLRDYKNSYPCPYVDGCAVPAPSEQQAYNFLWKNFMSYYNTTRAPFGLHMHAAWFYRRHNLKAMMRFLDDLMNFDDVYVVTAKQMLDWMRHPTPVKDIDTLQSWQCAESRRRKGNAIKHKTTIAPSSTERPKIKHFFDLFESTVLFKTRNANQVATRNTRPIILTKLKTTKMPSTTTQTTTRRLTTTTTRPTTTTTQPTTTTTRPTTTTTQTTTTRPTTTTTQPTTTRPTTTTTRPTTTTTRPTTTTTRPTTSTTQTTTTRPTTTTTQTTTTQPTTTTTQPTTTTTRPTTTTTRSTTTTTRPTTTTTQPTTTRSTTTTTRPTTTTTQTTTTLLTTTTTERPTTTTTQTTTTTLPTTSTTQATTTRPTTTTQATTTRPTTTTPQTTTLRSTTPTTTTQTSRKTKGLRTRMSTITVKTTKQSTSATRGLPARLLSTITLSPTAHSHFVSKDRVPMTKETRKSSIIRSMSLLDSLTAFKNQLFGIKPDQTTDNKLNPHHDHAHNHETHSAFPRDKHNTIKSTTKPSTASMASQSEYCAQGVNCHLPSCFCQGTKIPNGLKPEDTPQMVVITIDGSVNPRLFRQYKQLFNKRLNPNDCRSRGTIFATEAGSKRSMVKKVVANGAEIAMKGLHEHHFDTVEHMEQEIVAQKRSLNRNGVVGTRGWKTPELKAMGNDQFELLKKHGFLYDSTLSMATPRNGASNPWPFTLDYGFHGHCVIPECPTRRFSGVWEVPSIPVLDYKRKYECAYVDGCMLNPPSANLTEAFLWNNFLTNYKSNKAPFGIHLRQLWFSHSTYKPNLKGLKSFLDKVINLKDVFLVSTSDVIAWIQNPTPLNSITNKIPWNCS